MGDYIEKDVNLDENDYDVKIIKESDNSSNEFLTANFVRYVNISFIT